jgi:hypothetical protein
VAVELIESISVQNDTYKNFEREINRLIKDTSDYLEQLSNLVGG